ncbi:MULTISPECIES: exopolysaccharide production repressor protein [unclassified Sinorhizobium]|uniref:exopolysaccharide production repressor protein n=1 Tax=unclassified Sinorhizobium TaxID=2613772 RepID=UPI002868032C|nr:exopolysaccharide production repressor protein [Sinorhizobium sp. 8-89]
MLHLVLCTNALTVYFVSYSIRRVIITTLGTSLLLQGAYFGSVLFLIWRSGCTQTASKGRRIPTIPGEHGGKCILHGGGQLLGD